MAKTKFLITGGAGFIGSEITRLLLNAGFSVKVADDLSKKDLSASLKASTEIDKRAEFIKVDLTNSRDAKKVFLGIDICINAAAKIGGIGYFHKYPATILRQKNKL